MGDLELIWRPLRIGATTVRHRIMVAPHGQAYGENHQPSDRMVAYFAERARGGAALVGVEATSASRHLSGAQPGGATSGWRLTAWERRTIPAFARLADAVHEHDCRIFVQLSTGGVNDVGRAWIDDWHPVRGPSRVPSPIMNETPVALTSTDIDELTYDYGQSAANLQEAGIDGVEIHAAHGYLGMQFISPAFNKRSDAYGGSVANRCRFSIEAAEAIRGRVGDGMTVGMRLSFDEFIGEAGVTPELAEECLDILAGTGLFDYFSISCGSWYSLHRTVPPMGSAPEAFLAPYGKRAKAVVGDRAKVFLAGRVLDLDAAERVLADGAADMVAMVRSHLADPFLVQKTREGRQREIVRCAGTNECMALRRRVARSPAWSTRRPAGSASGERGPFARPPSRNASRLSAPDPRACAWQEWRRNGATMSPWSRARRGWEAIWTYCGAYPREATGRRSSTIWRSFWS